MLTVRHDSVSRAWHSLSRLLPPQLANRMQSRVPPGVRRISIDCGDETIHFDRLDQSTIFATIFWNGPCSEEGTTNLFEACARDAGVVFDIGSYIGYYAIIAAKANPRARVFSFEPLPAAAALQRHYLALNECANVELLELAIGDRVGEAEFFVPDRSASKVPNISSLRNVFRPGESFADRSARTIPVRVATIDTFMATHKLDRLDLVKIDVEEAEDAVVRGGMRAFSAFRPDIVAEFTEGRRYADEAFSRLKGIGYRAFSPEGLTEIWTFADFKPAHRLARAAYGEVFFSFKSDMELSRLRAAIGACAAK